MYFRGLIKIDFNNKFWKISITHLGKERFLEIVNLLNPKLIMSIQNKT